MEITPGMTRTQTFTVEARHTASHIGSGDLQVLSTPTMIAFMESTALHLIAEYLEPGFSSVGMRVDVRHLAPTALGQQVRVTATVQSVDGAKIAFLVEAREGEKLVGTGTHRRAVIQVERFLQNLQNRA